jgi:PilZ domain-containing protein
MKPRPPSKPSIAPSNSAADRRATPRFRVDRPVQFRRVENADGPPIDAQLLDVSAGGVGLRVSSPLVPGDEIFLLLFDAVELASTPLRYRVVRCGPLGEGQFLVGAAFVGNPQDAAVLTFAPRPEST